MNVLIIGTRFLPIPAVEGGAIEKLVDNYLNRKSENIITVYSPNSKKISKDILKKYKNVEFNFIDENNIKYKVIKYLLAIVRRMFKNKNIITPYLYLVIKNIKKHNSINKYDLIILENEVISLIHLRKFFKNSKIALHLHNDYLNKNTKYCNEIIDSCDYFFCVSKYIEKQIKGIDPKANTLLLYNGVDFSIFNKKVDLNEKKEFLEKNKIKKDDFIILYTGRIMEEKGVEELIKAFNNLKKKEKNMKLLLVGGPKNPRKEKNDEYYAKIKSMCNESIIMLGRMQQEKLKTIYSIADIQVTPSKWQEAFGLVIVEGMYNKVPIIATNTGGIPEIINKDCGIIVSTENLINNLEEKIYLLYKDYELRKKFATNGYNRSLEFSVEKYCERFDKVINEGAKK